MLTQYQNTQNPKKSIIYILAVLIILIIAVGITIYVIRHRPSQVKYDTGMTIKYPSVKYTHCSEKPLNRPTRVAFQALGIKFIEPNKIKTESGVLAQLPNSEPVHKIIYIPCSYNNSDWDIKEFIKTYFGPPDIRYHASKHKSKVEFKPELYISAVLGCNKLCAKNGLWSALERTYGREKARSIIPESWVIPAQSIAFQKQINRHATNVSKVFILKKNIQGKQGLLLTNSPETLSRLTNHSKSNSNNLIDDKYAVVQRYLSHPYLVNGRKLNIRLYILFVISRDSQDSQATPIPEWYLYNAGKCIYTNRAYQPLSSNTTIKSGSDSEMPLLEQHFTSLNLDTTQVYLHEKFPETLDELHTHMSARGENWPVIWKKIQLGLRKVATAYKDKLSLPHGAAKSYQIFGADYIIDATPANGNPQEPYLLEFNKGPEMKYKSPKDPELKSRLQVDILDLVLGPNNDPDKWISLNSVTKSKRVNKK